MIFECENGFSGKFLYITGEDGSKERFDVTGSVSLASEYSEKRMSRETIYSLIKELSDMGRELETKKLDKKGLILNPEYIYLSYGRKSSTNSAEVNNKLYRFIYYSGKSNQTFEGELMSLAEFVINHVNYGFRDAIYLAYDFYLHVFRNNYVFDDILA